MRFQSFHNDFFNTLDGAYSLVTEREYFDSQITLTDAEAEIVINHFGIDNIQVGNVSSNTEKASQTFHLFPESESVRLNLVFPKPNKTELRLYISSKAGFKPPAGNVWFIYESQSLLYLGSLPESEWNSLNQNDDYDAEYQNSIVSSVIQSVSYDTDPLGRIVTRDIGNRTEYVRDPRLARMRFDLTNNSCEIDPSHTTFTAQRTLLPYVEAHHFIPMKFQHLFDEPLDSLENIVSLCPNCHRGIHHAVADHRYGLIDNIYSKRAAIHDRHGLDDIAQFYNAIRIID